MFYPTPNELASGGMPESKVNANNAEAQLKARYASPKMSALKAVQSTRLGLGYVDREDMRVAKSLGKGHVIAIYNDRSTLTGFDVIENVSNATALRPVRKAGKKAPMRVLYDKNGRLVAYAAPADVRTTAKRGDIAKYFNDRGEPVFVNAADATEFATAKPTVQKTLATLRQVARTAVPSQAQRHAAARAQRHELERQSSVSKATTPTAARSTGYVFKDGGVYLGGKLIKRARRSADGSMVYSI